MKANSSSRVKLRRTLAQWWGWFGDWEVLLYGLDKAPSADFRRYISFRSMNVAIRPYLNDPEWQYLVSNKWIFALYYSTLGAPVPNVYGLLHPINGMTVGGERLRSKTEFNEWLHATRPPALVVKSLGGNQGRGVYLIPEIRWDNDEPILLTTDRQMLDVSEFYDSLDRERYRGLSGYLLQEWVAPHAQMEQLMGKAPHSVRVVTAVLPTGEVEVQLASIRMGFGEARVDSWSEGGLAGPVDPEAGKIGVVAQYVDHGGTVFERHPDTGRMMTGTVLPCWTEVRDAAIAMARLTPGLRVVGWDIVISDKGPRVIEGNYDWALGLVQAGTGGLLGTSVAETWRLLGADIPDGSWSWRWRHRRRPLAAMTRRLLARLES